MKSNTKSSVTLPQEELQLVQALKRRLKLKSNVEVIRRGLRLLQETTERSALKEAYRVASRATRRSTKEAIEDLDHLAGEGLD
jgi:Arc/MetJ-type ribon-helix-helix transcriptional regulator